jgi:hypothetical protein
MTEIQMFQPGKAFYDSYQQGRGNHLAGLAMNSQGEQRQSALAQLAGIDAGAAQAMKKGFDDQDRAELAEFSNVILNVPDELKPQVYAKGVQRFGSKFRDLGIEPPADYTQAMPLFQQFAGGGGKPKARSSHILADGTIAFMDEYGNLTKTGEKASNSFRPIVGANGEIIGFDPRSNIANPTGTGAGGQVQPPKPDLANGDPMNPVHERINYTAKAMKDAGVPVEQINAWAENAFAEAQKDLSANGVTTQESAPPPQQARVSVKPDASQSAPSGYRYNASGSLEPIPGGPADPAAKVAPRKAWTPAGLEKYNKIRTDIQVASTINTMMDDMANLFNDPQFELGPVQNKKYEFQNWSGQSTPQSQAYAKLSANFEKMRNDSLRLNAGVQTDGDAQRAWNEIMANMNDKELVKSRLADIKRYNEFALNEKRMQLENFDAEFGAPGSQRQAQPQATGANPPRIRTAEEYNRLPAGPYIDPNGKLRVKK